MYRAILPNGQLECEDYERDERGVELERAGGHAGADGELRAFVPFENLEALLTEAAYREDGRSVQ